MYLHCYSISEMVMKWRTVNSSTCSLVTSMLYGFVEFIDTWILPEFVDLPDIFRSMKIYNSIMINIVYNKPFSLLPI